MKLTEKKLLRAIGEADEQMVEKAAPKQFSGSVDSLMDFVPEQTEAPAPQKSRIIRRITEIGVLCAVIALCVFAGIGLVKLKRSVQNNKTIPSVQRAQAVLEGFLNAANAGDTEKVLDLTRIISYIYPNYMELTEDTGLLVYPFFSPNASKEKEISADDYFSIFDSDESFAAYKSKRDAAAEAYVAELKYDSWKIISGRYASDELEIRQKRLADRRDLQIFRFRERGEDKLAEREVERTKDALELLRLDNTVFTFEVTWVKDGEQITDTIDVYYDRFLLGEEYWEVLPFDVDAEPLTDAEQQELDAYRAKQAASGESPLKFTLYADFALINSCDVTACSVTIPAEYQGLPVTGFSGEGVFLYCSNLTEIKFEDNHGQFNASDFGSTPWLQKLEKDDPMVICGDTLVFARYVTDQKVVIPYGVKYISNQAFYGNDQMTSVIIPDSVVRIGNSAFGICENLGEVSIPESVTEIGSYAFYATPWIDEQREIQSPVIVNSILIDARNSPDGTVIPDGVAKIAGNAFVNSEITELTVPDSVTEVDRQAFSSMTRLESITLPSSITRIPPSAFSDCTSLTAFTVPDGVTIIGTRTFSRCSALTSVTIPDSVTIIDKEAFEDCEQLRDVYIPDSVTFIGDFAFSKSELSNREPLQLTLHGKAGSAAEVYAKENDIPFIAE